MEAGQEGWWAREGVKARPQGVLRLQAVCESLPSYNLESIWFPLKGLGVKRVFHRAGSGSIRVDWKGIRRLGAPGGGCEGMRPEAP